jgi:hypothetical protein
MNDSEKARARAYRRAAQKVFDAYKPIRTFSMSVTFGGTGRVDLFPEAEFVRLLAAVRLVYMERENGNFFKANNVLRRYGDEELRSEAESIRTGWNEALHHGYDLVFLPKEATSPEKAQQLRPEDVLDTFLNAEYFHQDEDRTFDLERLEKLGSIGTHYLHVTVWKLTRLILVQDLLLADFLNEPRLPLEEVFSAAPPPNSGDESLPEKTPR